MGDLISISAGIISYKSEGKAFFLVCSWLFFNVVFFSFALCVFHTCSCCESCSSVAALL